MATPGFVYVLMNPSLDGIVKIGKTTRTPSDRASELSSATGVPTPFHLVYFSEFADCDAAERALHADFTERQMRISDNREFFRMPIHEAVSAIVALHKVHSSLDGAQSIRESESLQDGTEGSSLIRSLVEDANDHFHGQNGRFRDIPKAISIFKKAAALGDSETCRILGFIYGTDETVRDLQESKNYLLRGIELGDVVCYAVLARTFARLNERRNVEKAWGMFFSNIEQLDKLLRGEYCADYVSALAEYDFSGGFLELTRTKYADEIVEYFTIMVASEEAESGKDHWRRELDVVLFLLLGTPMSYGLEGTVKYFDRKKGYGYISGNGGDEHFLHHTQIRTKNRFPKEKDRVQFHRTQTENGFIAQNVCVM